MATLIVLGEEVSSTVPPLLKRQGEGIVHSLFPNGCNIRMGGSLLFIGNSKYGRLPFGIHLNKDDTDNVLLRLSLNDRVLWDESSNTLRVSTVIIRLDQSPCYESRISLSNSRNVLARLNQFSVALISSGKMSGLAISFSKLKQNLYRTHEETESTPTGTEHQLRKLVRAMFLEDARFIEKCLRYFIGRGQGLTPSGDDLLVGILAVDAAVPMLSPVFKQTLHTLIHNDSLTTEISREYLRHALAGDFGSILISVIDGLSAPTDERCFNEDVNRLLQVGHSSGCDTALGILAFLTAIEEREHRLNMAEKR